MTKLKPVTLAVRRMKWLAAQIETAADSTPFVVLQREWSARLRDFARDLDTTDARETRPDPRLRKRK